MSKLATGADLHAHVAKLLGQSVPFAAERRYSDAVVLAVRAALTGATPPAAAATRTSVWADHEEQVPGANGAPLREDVSREVLVVLNTVLHASSATLAYQDTMLSMTVPPGVSVPSARHTALSRFEALAPPELLPLTRGETPSIPEEWRATVAELATFFRRAAEIERPQ